MLSLSITGNTRRKVVRKRATLVTGANVDVSNPKTGQDSSIDG
jgi:hypothetical protein